MKTTRSFRFHSYTSRLSKKTILWCLHSDYFDLVCELSTRPPYSYGSIKHSLIIHWRLSCKSIMVQITHFKRRKISICDKIRISLAYKELETIPRRILKYISSEIEILDLSYNGLVDLSFLINFPKLKTLILDRNFKLDHTSFPDMKSLEILWWVFYN